MESNKVLSYLHDPKKVLLNLLEKYPHFIKDDKTYLQLEWLFLTGKTLNLKNPQTFNEKLNWMKLHFTPSAMDILADKYSVKDYVRNLVGSDYVVPCYGVWDSFDEIDFDALPSQFVLKATNDSSGVCICNDKNSLNKEELREHFKTTTNHNYYWHKRKPSYKNIKPRIIADALLDDDSGHESIDYKFWCFNGVPKYMYCTNKATDIFENFYDMEFNPVDISHGFRRFTPEFEKPGAFEEMKKIASKLSKGYPFIRIDFFYVKGKVYFGEFTFYDWAGLKPFSNPEWDKKLGKLIDLSIIG